MDRHAYYRQAIGEHDPARRDSLLAMAEAALIGNLTHDLNNQYGDATQDPRSVHLVEDPVPLEQDPTCMEYWADMIPEQDCRHGWPTDGSALNL